MIIYATKETVERLKLKLPDEMTFPIAKYMAQSVLEHERGDRLLEWGAKLFYFDRRKCVQIVNFASKLTFFLVDVRVKEIPQIGNMVVEHLMCLYEDDPETLRLLDRYLDEQTSVVFSKLTDRSIISTMNLTQRQYLGGGYRLCEYIENNILMTRKISKELNRKWLFGGKIDGRTEYFYAAQRFAQLLEERYADE